MRDKFNFRKAADGGNLIVISVAIGVLVLVGMYMMSQSNMTKNAEKQGIVNDALIQGVENLKNS